MSKTNMALVVVALAACIGIVWMYTQIDTGVAVEEVEWMAARIEELEQQLDEAQTQITNMQGDIDELMVKIQTANSTIEVYKHQYDGMKIGKWFKDQNIHEIVVYQRAEPWADAVVMSMDMTIVNRYRYPVGQADITIHDPSGIQVVYVVGYGECMDVVKGLQKYNVTVYVYDGPEYARLVK